MIKLPDFSKCVEFHRLKESMGVETIPILPRVEFTREIVVQKKVSVRNDAALALENSLKNQSLDVSYSDIIPDQNGLLTYKGRKVSAYIRDQRRGISYDSTTYRYHLCNCSTLRYMKSEGRLKRYFVTKKDTGYFQVHDLSGYRMARRELKLELCKNCIRELSERSLYFSPFSLNKFFERYDSQIPKTITKTISEKRIQTYAPNQDDISREYRKAAQYCCQSCKVNCTVDPSLLHLHHLDGDPSNNDHKNLRVLCIDCHSKQPMHTHVAQPYNAKQKIKEIKRLRTQQGITDLGISL